MAKTAAKKKRPSKEQVKVWLSTVVGPMADGLSTEIDHLEERSLSYKVDARDFEYLWPTSKMMARPYLLNRVQYLRTAPEIGRNCERHDGDLAKLRKECSEVLDALLSFPRFIQLAAASEPMYQRYLAENVVNDMRELSRDNVHEKLWLKHGQDFLSLRDLPQFKGSFARIRKFSASLLKVAKELHEQLQEQQLDLAEEFKLPAVDPEMRGLA